METTDNLFLAGKSSVYNYQSIGVLVSYRKVTSVRSVLHSVGVHSWIIGNHRDER